MKNTSWSSTRLDSVKCLQLYDYRYDPDLTIQIETDINLIAGLVNHDAIKMLFQGSGQGKFEAPGRPFYFRSAYKFAAFAIGFLLPKYLQEADQKAGIYWGYQDLAGVKRKIREALEKFFHDISYPKETITFFESEYGIKDMPLGNGAHFEVRLDAIWRFDDRDKIAIIDFASGSSPASRKTLQMNCYYVAFQLEAARNPEFGKKYGNDPQLFVYQLLTGEMEKIEATENLESLRERIESAALLLEQTTDDRRTKDLNLCRFCLYRNPCRGLEGPAPKKDNIQNRVPPRISKRSRGNRRFPCWDTFGVAATREVNDPLAVQYCGEHPGEKMVWNGKAFVCPQPQYVNQ